jgi:hypothetical protein
MSFERSRSIRPHGLSAYLFFLFLASLQLYHPHPSMADQSGGVRRVIVRARPPSDEVDETVFFGNPPKLVSFIPEKKGSDSGAD